MDEIKFGTDGFRAIISDGFTFENVTKISKALACYLISNKPKQQAKGVIIGFDRRFLSDKFAYTVAKVLSEHGILAKLTK